MSTSHTTATPSSVQLDWLEDDIVKTEMRIILLCDRSSSMYGRRIETLNQAIHELIPQLRKAVAEYPEVRVTVQAIAFDNEAQFHIGPEPVPLDELTWPDLSSCGVTATSQAIDLLTETLEVENMPRRGLPPLCLLISDGFCTDSQEMYNSSIERLVAGQWGRRAIRLAIGIGRHDEDYNEEELLRFVSHKKSAGVLEARNAEQLTQYVQWACLAGTLSTIKGLSQAASDQSDPEEVDENQFVALDVAAKPAFDDESTSDSWK